MERQEAKRKKKDTHGKKKNEGEKVKRKIAAKNACHQNSGS